MKPDQLRSVSDALHNGAEPGEVWGKIAPKRKRKEAPDWFGCGRVITTESWNAFLAARKAYYVAQDRAEGKEE